MSGCDINRVDEFRCPTKWELWRQAIDLLPPGRAWQRHEEVGEIVGHVSAQFGTYPVGDGVGLGASDGVKLTVMQQWWAAFAEVSEYFHQRACELLNEYFCETTSEQRAEWGIDYGFPADCEPWDSLCDKVRAQGGSTCAYLAELAARTGWVIDCSPCSNLTDSAGCMESGCNSPCSCPQNVIYVRMFVARSPASATGSTLPLMQAGVMLAGCHDTSFECRSLPEPQTAGVVCLVEKYKPAHVKAIYQVIET